MSNNNRTGTRLRSIKLLLVALLLGVAGGLVAPSAASAAPLSTQRVQWNLAAMSYLKYSDADGVSGPKTTAAVKQFQADQCLAADGIVGPATDARLQSVMRQIQAKVGVTQDGAAGPATRDAIKAYQARNGLTADGYAGPATFAKMGLTRTCTPPSGGGSSQVIHPLNAASDRVACAAGTRDLGVHQGFYQGKGMKVRLCAIPGFASTGAESTPGSRYYIKGANREAIVNARVSGPVRDLFAAAKRSGVTMRAGSTFRSHAHQTALWNNNPDSRMVARPGTSAHQGGYAIDFSGITAKNRNATCATRATQWGNAQYKWLRDNASRFGMKQYAVEAWHWDFLPLSSRCS